MNEISQFTSHIIQIFLEWPYLKVIFALVVLLVLYFLSRKLFQKLLLGSIKRIVFKSEVLWDDHLWEKKAFISLVNIVPLMVVYGATGWFPEIEVGMKVFIKGLIILQLSLLPNLECGKKNPYQKLSTAWEYGPLGVDYFNHRLHLDGGIPLVFLKWCWCCDGYFIVGL